MKDWEFNRGVCLLSIEGFISTLLLKKNNMQKFHPMCTPNIAFATLLYLWTYLSVYQVMNGPSLKGRALSCLICTPALPCPFDGVFVIWLHSQSMLEGRIKGYPIDSQISRTTLARKRHYHSLYQFNIRRNRIFFLPKNWSLIMPLRVVVACWLINFFCFIIYGLPIPPPKKKMFCGLN